MTRWQTDTLRLRGIETSDAEALQAIYNDMDLMHVYSNPTFPSSLAYRENWVTEQAKRSPHEDQFIFILEPLPQSIESPVQNKGFKPLVDEETGGGLAETPAGKIAGVLNTFNADPRVGNFYYGIAVLPEYRGRGFAKSAIGMVLGYYFEDMRYQKCTIGIHSDNAASIRLHEQLGFKLEARLRRMFFLNGQYLDRLVYGLTVEEYREKFAVD